MQPRDYPLLPQPLRQLKKNRRSIIDNQPCKISLHASKMTHLAS